ncbi:MAG: LemA family protein [Sulfuricurvum sp.]|uniref:LemA family protein n=1 Tax=Sulfuricurvum sp. TaxID=2025608 RepID=UPI002604904D|nr:LemA family protein [Sulfuricurvum sp.]MDD2829320.1 LemA family protein [Sulfuricurvum sp.]MDD4948637.1 LemA family protein [Sulfuricurvum sp.]
MTVFLSILGVVALIAILIYNSLIGKKNQVDNIFAGVDTVLKKRYDLIPNLVASVERYMEHEKSTLEKVTEYRAQAMKPGISDDQKIALDAKLTSALGAINIAMEAYPDLKANENVMHLMRTLNEIEEQISAARRAYNQSVTDLNNAIEMFPTNIVAGWMNLQRRLLFEITTTERQNVNVHDLFNRS